jgi:ABC-type Fe3+ transport system substrate-binding protein
VVPAPIVAGQFGATVMAKATHPNAARLLAGWEASAEGRKARRDNTFTTDLSKGTTDPLAMKLLASGQPIIYDTEDKMADRVKFAAAAAPVISGQAN